MKDGGLRDGRSGRMEETGEDLSVGRGVREPGEEMEGGGEVGNLREWKRKGKSGALGGAWRREGSVVKTPGSHEGLRSHWRQSRKRQPTHMLPQQIFANQTRTFF